MAQQLAPNLKLTITNPTAVASGVRTEHVFTPQGGSIGTAQSDTWRLSAHRTGAVAGHAEVRYIDGAYCLIDRSGRTYVNASSQPVGRGRRARLKDGDIIAIGRYQLQTDLAPGQRASDYELEGASRRDDELVQGTEGELLRPQLAPVTSEQKEPLSGLQSAPAQPVSDDPLAGFEPESAQMATHEGRQLREQELERQRLLADQPHWRAAAGTVTDEYRDNRDVALGLPLQPGASNRQGQPGEQDRMSTDVRETGLGSDQEHSRKHISGAPLLRGMEAELSFADSDDMRLFLEEAGQTLKATVDGLLALHQNEDSRHRALRTRLQPIEDNPLRLGQHYDDTVQTLFASQRSPVHLSAPAAVRESLDGLRQHQQATQAAIAEALDAILHAFSPAALLRRFHGYRRGLQDGENEAEWAWQMYQHYYRELSSSRQQGFERLFQEVFEQAYDQHLRQLQRESLT